eukprot:GHUV01016592.1.p2 GENE.GHUV01016592.1~~GHUV01016592.1.p2  ORF type:complete len:111 (+),score=4.87 GHUV01016592.1:1089-1421(+)
MLRATQQPFGSRLCGLFRLPTCKGMDSHGTCTTGTEVVSSACEGLQFPTSWLHKLFETCEGCPETHWPTSVPAGCGIQFPGGYHMFVSCYWLFPDGVCGKYAVHLGTRCV